MAEYELIQDRSISGKGLLKVPTDKKKLRHVVLYTDVFREPKNKYYNANYNPPRSRYATLNFFRESYLINSIAVEFPKQAFDNVNDVCGQTLIAIKCAYDGLLQSFVNLAVAMSATPGGVGLTYEGKVDLIKDYENLRLAWDEIRVQCHADTALQIRMYAVKYDSCTADRDDDKPPPPPPPPRSSVPPGTPITDLSPPYDGSSDSGNTSPYSGDQNPPPPPGPIACQKYRIDYTWNYVNALNQPAGRRTTSVNCWGKVTSARIQNGYLYATCQGPVASPCGVLKEYLLYSSTPENTANPNFVYTVTAI